MKNKFYFFAALLIGMSALPVTISAQAPAWSWATSHGAVSNDIGTSITTDASGNVYATGYFSDASITIGTTTLVNANAAGTSADIYVAKFDASGNSVWAMSFGGANDDRGQSIITDAAGNFYLTGSFQSLTINFGALQLNNANSNNTSDAFIAKFNSSGTAIWATRGGGLLHDLSGSVSMDGAGNLYIAGSFNSTSVTFGSFTQTNTSTNYNMYLAKFDSNGNAKWLRRPSGANYNYANGIVADAAGNIYVTGSFNGPSITFGSTVLTNTLSVGSPAFFLAKCDSSGTPLWAKTTSATGFNQGFAVTLDAAGDAIVTGQYGGTSLTFGSVTITNSNGAYGGLFIAKYDAAGNALWAKSGDGVNNNANNNCWSVTTDVNNQIFCAGSFTGPSITFGSTVLTNSGSIGTTDIFAAAFDSNGNSLWAKSGGGTNTEVAMGITANNSGCLFVTGNSFSNSMIMDNITLTATGGSVFFAQLCPITGEQLISAKNNYFIYPNPSSGIFYAEFKTQDEANCIEVYNSMGKKIFSAATNKTTGVEKTIACDLSEQPAGIYFANVISSGLRSVKKIIVSKE